MIIETITPIHIGNGDEYFGWEIQKIKNNFYRVDIPELIIKNIKTSTQKIDDAQILPEHITHIPDEKKMEHIMYKIDKITTDINILKERRIYEHIKTIQNNELVPYIPGSTIKGMLRTFKIMEVLDGDVRLINKILYYLRGIKGNKPSLLESDVTVLRDKKIKNDRDLLKVHHELKKFSRNVIVRDFIPTEYELSIREVIIKGKKKKISVLCELAEGEFKGDIICKTQDIDINNLINVGMEILNKIKIGKYTGLEFHSIAPLIWKLNIHTIKKPISIKKVDGDEIGIIRFK